MTLEVAPLQLADLDQLVHHADKGEPGDDCVAPPNPVAWPVKTRAEAQFRARIAMALQRRRLLRDPTVRFLKVVDPGLPDDDNIIAVARWHYYPEGYKHADEAHWEMAPDTLEPLIPYMSGDIDHHSKEQQEEYPPPNFNLALHNYILSDRDAFRPTWMVSSSSSSPCWILMHLTTRPSHRNRGAARLLIEWGTRRASESGVPAYLEAGAAARPIYGKFGFEQVGDIRKLDLRPHGLDATFELTSMAFNRA